MENTVAQISIQVTGLPDSIVHHPDDIIPIKARADYHAVRYLRKYRNIRKRSVTDFDLATHYIPASQLTIGDWYLLPRRINLPPVELTPDQLYVAGFWLAEGHHLKESKKGTRDFGKPVGICVTNTDRSYLEYIQPILHDWFPSSASHIRTEKRKQNPLYKTKHVLEFRSRDAASFFYPTFGEYPGKKAIVTDLYERSGLLPLVCGFIDGDGCQFKKGVRPGDVSIITTSQQLAYQLRQILLDEGIWTILQQQDHRNVKHNRSYWLSITSTRANALIHSKKIINTEVGKMSHKAIPTPEGFYARVKQITQV